ncbi:MAG: UvrD-helicase domain-containing protein, partial [Mucilaginibacter polytrichastri]|nr:UvrD-helicase domain-containing protein [Mucilaginibacter polytrichastri]
RQILHDYSRFSVNTIDGFVQKVIRSFSYELGLDAGYRLEMNINKVKNDLADKLNKVLDKKPDLLEWIIRLAIDRITSVPPKNWNYRSALLDLSGELFKERYAAFDEAIRDKEPAVVFKALKEQTRNVIASFEDKISSQAKTALEIFESTGVLLTELKGKSRSPLANLQKIAEGDYDKIAGLEKLIGEPEEWQKGGLSADVQFLYDNLEPVLAKLITGYEEAVLIYETAKAIDANLYYLRLMQEMSVLLSDYRKDNHLLLISDAQNLLKGITGGQEGNPSFVWEKTGSRYRHFLFDEFQDTSTMQWRNFLPLVQNALAMPGDKYTDHLIVGDVKQSIYRWRGGDWKILLKQARTDIGDWNVGGDSLEENYRSAANIIDFNNFLFRHIPELLQTHINEKVRDEGGEQLFMDWWFPSSYHAIITDAYAQSQQLKAPSTPLGGCIELAFLPVENNQQRPTHVRDSALEKLSQTLDGWIGTKRYKAGQICILVRSNTEARQTIEFLMQNQQLKPESERYQILSGEALLVGGNAAVNLLINTLRAMVCKQDEAALYLANCVQLHAVLHDREIAADDWMKISDARPEELKSTLPPDLCINWRTWQALPLVEITEKLINVFTLQKKQQALPF